MFDRERYERALAQMDEALTFDDYYAGLYALAEAQGRVPDPAMLARRLGIREGPSLPEPERSFQPSTRSAADSRRARFRSLDASDVREWSDFTITVAPSVFSRIEREIVEAVWAFDSSVETGGWLFSYYAPDEAEAKIMLATGPGPSAKHAAGRLKLSHPRELENELVPGAVLVGDWHTHPGTWTGDPTDQASDADEEAWKGRSEHLASCSRWVSLVFTPGELGWTNPIYHGYLTHRNEDGVVVCEQATVTEGQISSGWASF